MSEPVFKKVRHGYDCAQVASFLIEMNRSFEDKEALLNAEIKRLTVALDREKAERAQSAADADEKQKELETALEAKTAECETLSQKIGTVEDAEKRAREILRDANDRANELLQAARQKGNAESAHLVNSVRQQCSIAEWTITDFSERMASIQSEVMKAEDMLADAVRELEKGLNHNE